MTSIMSANTTKIGDKCYVVHDAVAEEIERLRENIEEAVECLGVRYLYYNGVHQALLNQTNIPVKYFKSRDEAKAWVDETNAKNETARRCQTGNHIDDEIIDLKNQILSAK